MYAVGLCHAGKNNASNSSSNACVQSSPALAQQILRTRDDVIRVVSAGRTLVWVVRHALAGSSHTSIVGSDSN